MDWYLEVLRKYAVFSGRARRKEYWMFYLINFIIGVLLGIIAGIISEKLMILAFLYTLAIIIPALAVTVRRLHDTGRSGFWVLISLVPLFGAIILLIFMILDSDQGENQYGPNPKAPISAEPVPEIVE